MLDISNLKQMLESRNSSLEEIEKLKASVKEYERVESRLHDPDLIDDKSVIEAVKARAKREAVPKQIDRIQQSINSLDLEIKVEAVLLRPRLVALISEQVDILKRSLIQSLQRYCWSQELVDESVNHLVQRGSTKASTLLYAIEMIDRQFTSIEGDPHLAAQVIIEQHGKYQELKAEVEAVVGKNRNN